MSTPFVVIVMGSRSDEGHCRKIAEALAAFGVQTVLRVGSAHKTAQHTLNLVQTYDREARPKVFIVVAGRSNALCGFVDGAVSAPVITCPPYSEAFGGADIFSALRMPSGIAPGVVLEPANAALLAVKILGQCDQALRARLEEYQKNQMQKIFQDDAEIQA